MELLFDPQGDVDHQRMSAHGQRAISAWLESIGFEWNRSEGRYRFPGPITEPDVRACVHRALRDSPLGPRVMRHLHSTSLSVNITRYAGFVQCRVRFDDLLPLGEWRALKQRLHADRRFALALMLGEANSDVARLIASYLR